MLKEINIQMFSISLLSDIYFAEACVELCCFEIFEKKKISRIFPNG